MQIDTDLFLGSGIVIPLRSALGYSEDWQPVAPTTFRQTSRGKAIALSQWYKRKYAITISASGEGIRRVPGLDHLQGGDELVLHSCQPMTAMIPQGTKQCVLSRPHVPGSVRVIRTDSDEAETVIPHTEHAGRIIRVAANAPAHYAVTWRPAVTVLFGSVSYSVDQLTKLASWTLELMEKDAPQ